MTIMTLLFLGVMAFTLIAIIILLVQGTAKKLMRVLLSLSLFAFTAFCSFGFLATYEPGDGHLTWRIGYGVAVIASLYGVARLLRGGSKG
jgi:hypothetical protein